MPAPFLRLSPLLLLASHVLAHGGQYPPLPPPPPTSPPTRPGGPGGGHHSGPGDVVPPSPGGGGRTPAGPAGPTGPNPTAPGDRGKPTAPPTTGGPAGPTAPAPTGGAGPAAVGVKTGARGAALEPDFDTWEYWWECNKNGYLRQLHAQQPTVTGSDDFYLGATRRAEAVDGVRPTRDDAMQVVLPALKRALDTADQRDITSSCMVAMAKIGLDHPDFRLVDVFAARLTGADQEVRETAALSLGIAASAEARSLDLLAGLALDDQVGRAARGGEVDERTRAYATYGLGLTAHHHARLAVQQRIFAVLRQLLDRDARASRDVRIAATHAVGLLQLGERSHGAARLRAEALDLLTARFLEDRGGGDEIVQAHCPTAIARLAGRDAVLAAPHVARFVVAIGDGERRRGSAIAQSCALALGQMAAPNDGPDSSDAEVSKTLLATSHQHADRLTQHFALIALARIGGAANREALLREFDDARRSQRLPWCALALGVLEHERCRRTPGAEPDAFLAATLHDALVAAKEPGLVGALGIALGMCRATGSADLLCERLKDGIAKETMAGYLAIGLSLLQDRRAVEDLRRVLREAERRPDLLVRVAIALGRLGDRATAEDLLQAMTASEANLAKVAALAAAISQIGDRRSIQPLVVMLHDTRLGGLARGFAAVALGGVCDRLPLPWNTPIGADINYRATVPTLSDQVAGVLDIL